MAATTLKTLSAVDQTDFQGRLAVYGKKSTDIAHADLVVPANKTVVLSAADPKSALKPQTLTTSSLADLKTWIGIPDALYKERHLNVNRVQLPTMAAAQLTTQLAAKPVARTAVGAAGAQVAVQAPVTDHLMNVHTAASAYLFGNSQLVTAYAPAIEKYFSNFQIIFWPFYTITVNAGSTLKIGPGQSVLFAWKIIIHQGGTVECSTGLKVDATILQKA